MCSGPKGDLADTMSRSEMALYDNLKTLSFLSLFAFLLLLAIATLGCKAAEKQKSWAVKYIMHKTKLLIIAFLVVTVGGWYVFNNVDFQCGITQEVNYSNEELIEQVRGDNTDQGRQLVALEVNGIGKCPEIMA